MNRATATISYWLFSSTVIGQNKTAGPPGRVAAANWQPLRSLSHLMKTKRTQQIQRSSDNKWDFPASLPLCQNRTMNPSLRNNPRIQQATNSVGRDRQAGEGRFYFDGFERHVGGQETNAAGPRPLIGPRRQSLVCFHLFSLPPPHPTSTCAKRLPSSGLPSPDAGPQCARCCVSPPPSESET